jgi:hypothetical protein
MCVASSILRNWTFISILIVTLQCHMRGGMCEGVVVPASSLFSPGSRRIKMGCTIIRGALVFPRPTSSYWNVPPTHNTSKLGNVCWDVLMAIVVVGEGVMWTVLPLPLTRLLVACPDMSTTVRPSFLCRLPSLSQTKHMEIGHVNTLNLHVDFVCEHFIFNMGRLWTQQ